MWCAGPGQLQAGKVQSGSWPWQYALKISVSMRFTAARHVDKARSKSLVANEERVATGFTPHHVALWKLVRRSRRVPSGKLCSVYVARCKEANVRPIAPRTYSKYISHLTRAGLIRPVGRNGGSRVFTPGANIPSFHS